MQEGRNEMEELSREEGRIFSTHSIFTTNKQHMPTGIAEREKKRVKFILLLGNNSSWYSLDGAAGGGGEGWGGKIGGGRIITSLQLLKVLKSVLHTFLMTLLDSPRLKMVFLK